MKSFLTTKMKEKKVKMGFQDHEVEEEAKKVKLDYAFDMSKYTTWNEHTFKFFRFQMEKHFGDRPDTFQCLIQLAIFDKII